MKEYKNTRSTVKPNAIKIDEYSVWISENIEEINEEEFTGYEYDMTQYSIEEYNALQSPTLKQQLSDLQDVLNELIIKGDI